MRTRFAVPLMLAIAISLTAFAAPLCAQTGRPKAKSASRKIAAPLEGAGKVDAIAADVFDGLNAVIDMHFHKGEYNHIVNLSRMVVAAQPDNLETYANAGWLLWSMDRDTEAVALYEQGAKANPGTAYMYDELGQYYYNRKKDYPRAVAYYEQAASKPDCSPITLHMLAHAYERNKQMDMALATWKRVLHHDDAGAARVNYDRVKRLMDAGSSPR